MRQWFVWPRIGLVIGLLFTLSACGSNGTSSGDLVINDGLPPTVVSRTPAPGNKNVSVRTPFQVTFSEAIDPKTISASSVSVTGNGNTLLGKKLALSGDQTSLTIEFIRNPDVPDDFTVTMTNAITDLRGNNLILPTDDWSFSAPPWLRVGDGQSAVEGATDSFDPSIAVDESGDIVIAWHETADSGNDIHVRRWDGTTWSTLGEPLDANDGSTSASYPSLALDASGNPTVAWVEWDGSANNIYVHRWDGTGWNALGVALSANGDTGTPASDPSLVVDDLGNPTVAWSERENLTGPTNIYVQTWDGNNWIPMGSALSANNDIGTNAARPSLAVDSAGIPTVAWYEWTGVTYASYVRRWNGTDWDLIGGGLSANSGSVSHAFDPSLALDASGNPTVAWFEYDSEDFATNVYVRRWSGSIWEPIGDGELSANPGSTSAREVVLAIDESGDLVVAWREEDSSFAYDVYVQRWDGNAWETVGGPVSANTGSTPAITPSLALDDFGQPVVAWREYATTSYEIFVQRYNQ